MTTQGISAGNVVWINLIDELNLETGKGYILQNVSFVSHWYSEQESIPVDGDPYHIFLPKALKNIIPQAGIGIWVKSENNSSRITLSVTEDRSIVVTEDSRVDSQIAKLFSLLNNAILLLSKIETHLSFVTEENIKEKDINDY